MSEPLNPAEGFDAPRHDGSVRASRILRLAVVLPLLLGVVVEVAAFVLLANWIGVFWTLLLVVGGSLLGFVLIANEGRRSFTAALEMVRSGQDPGIALVGGVLGFIGGLAMIVPGLVNTVVGLLLVTSRPVLARPVSAVVRRRAHRHGVSMGSQRPSPGASSGTGAHDVVPGEVVDPEDPPTPRG